MSTRSMTLVQQPYSGKDSFIALYRHCDGYPAEAGAAVIEALRQTPPPADRICGPGLSCEDIVRRLLAGDLGEYRLADWTPSDQGDLEHVYVLTRKDGIWSVRWAHREGWDEKQESWRDWPQANYSLAEFVRIVNCERKQTNARIAQLRKSSAAYADREDYPMLEEANA